MEFIPEIVLAAYLLARVVKRSHNEWRWNLRKVISGWKGMLKKCIKDKSIIALEMLAILTQINI